MPLENSPALQERLLDLFPAASIHDTDYVEEAMTKDEAIQLVVANAEIQDLYRFLSSNFGLLHQHVYVFEWDSDDIDPELPFERAPVATVDAGDERHLFYLLQRKYQLVLDDPLEHAELNFVWPVKLVLAPDHLRVHFTIMAKSPTAHVPENRRVVRATPYPAEWRLLEALQSTVGIAGRARRMDLNRGIKTLWEDDEFDAPTVQYKRAKATSKDVMDEEYTVKKDDPDLYEALQDKPLFKTTFVFTAENPCIKYIVANPSEGSVTFRRFSSTNDCVDDVLRGIVEAN